MPVIAPPIRPDRSRGLGAGLTALSAALLLAACGSASPAGEPAATDEAAQTAAFFARNTVSIIVGSGAGGGFDTTARLVARHIGRHIPGTPTVIVVNMPGGGGLVAANHVFNTAPKDGTVIGLFHEAQVMNQLTGAEGVRFDVRAFNWLGSSYDDPNVCLVRAGAPVTAFRDLVGGAGPLALGGTAPGSNGYDAPRVLAAATGANIRTVAGYSTTSDVRLGIERGEIDGMCLGWESIRSGSTEWLDEGYARVLVQNGTARHPDLPDAPLALDFARDEKSRVLLRLLDAPSAMAKPFTLPPGVDERRVEVLRRALAAVYRDPAFLADAETLRLRFQPKTADEVQQILREVLATPPHVAAEYRRIIQP